MKHVKDYRNKLIISGLDHSSTNHRKHSISSWVLIFLYRMELCCDRRWRESSIEVEHYRSSRCNSGCGSSQLSTGIGHGCCHHGYLYASQIKGGDKTYHIHKATSSTQVSIKVVDPGWANTCMVQLYMYMQLWLRIHSCNFPACNIEKPRMELGVHELPYDIM